MPPARPDAKAASFAALVKGTPDERPRGFSTADASRLVPIVAVAPKALLDSRETAVRDWSKAWLDGLARAKSDVPGIARRLAAKEALPLAAGVGGVQPLGESPQATVGRGAHGTGSFAEDGARRGGVQTEDGAQQDGFGLVGREGADEGDGVPGAGGLDGRRLRGVGRPRLGQRVQREGQDRSPALGAEVVIEEVELVGDRLDVE